MINLSKLTAILAEHKLSAEQSEELQKVIYGLDDGNIIELANMPCAGDTAYVYFKTINGHSRLLTVEYKGSFKKYTKDKDSAVLHFVFVCASSESASKQLPEFTADDWSEAYVYPFSGINNDFFFDRAKAIKMYHNLCCLDARHIDEAKMCIGFEDTLCEKTFKIRRNHITFDGSPEDTLGSNLWESLFKCGFANVSISNEDGYSCVYSLTPIGLEWLSIFTNIKIII